MNLQNESLSSVNIVIDDRGTFNAIGADVLLTDCVIESSVPARALSIRATLTGGEFKTKVQLDGFFWCEARLERVKFSGRYRNNRFGHLPEFGLKGAVEGCDFASATLIDCEFYDCDVESLVFPVWPHLTVLHPKQVLTDLESHTISPPVSSFFEFLEYLDDDCDAIVRNVEKLTLPDGFPYDELRGLVSQVSNFCC
ncbi:hypothetical protein [Lignipirellula cremea]|uniref:Pentapeptide repeats (8 copies) n=1 Tax=Lignipirellula cremea TaxID=2528010 RepID=A0A518E008_9BACT|nr:hypothetical protein [Lignipirellula cremea]QDU97423.1 hypothetical protein Pla8534_52710 [Lignipirellula cremea]